MSDARRRGGRIPKQLAILLIGSDVEGRMFSERTKTVVLSRHGAGITSEHKLSAEQELVIRLVDSNREAEVRVVGQIGSAGDTYIYGVAFLQPDLNFWGLEFPPLTEEEKRASRTLLECTKCRSRETANHSDLESDVYAVNESIMRHCKRCGSSTLWRQPSGPVTEAETKDPEPVALRRPGVWQPDPRSSIWADSQTQQSGFAESDSEQESTVTVAAPRPPLPRPEVAPVAPVKLVHSKDENNRRKHARTKVNFKARIRRPDGSDEVVACEDMSKGGIRFRSQRCYVEKAMIEVAVPYTPGDSAIFVPAQIAWVVDLPEQKMWRCGAAYIRNK